MRTLMLQAAEKDSEENLLGRPAIYKLKLLPSVVEIMQKYVPPLPLPWLQVDEIIFQELVWQRVW